MKRSTVQQRVRASRGEERKAAQTGPDFRTTPQPSKPSPTFAGTWNSPSRCNYAFLPLYFISLFIMENLKNTQSKHNSLIEIPGRQSPGSNRALIVLFSCRYNFTHSIFTLFLTQIFLRKFTYIRCTNISCVVLIGVYILVPTSLS